MKIVLVVISFLLLSSQAPAIPLRSCVEQVLGVFGIKTNAPVANPNEPKREFPVAGLRDAADHGEWSIHFLQCESADQKLTRNPEVASVKERIMIGRHGPIPDQVHREKFEKGPRWFFEGLELNDVEEKFTTFSSRLTHTFPFAGSAITNLCQEREFEVEVTLNSNFQNQKVKCVDINCFGFGRQ